MSFTSSSTTNPNLTLLHMLFFESLTPPGPCPALVIVCSSNPHPKDTPNQNIRPRNVASSTAGTMEATPNCTCIYVSHVHGHLGDQLDVPMALTTMDRRKA